MMLVLSDLWRALVLAIGMFWQVGWSLVLGFAISGLLQTVVSKDQMRRALGRNGLREVALATVAGAASSSCSYAAASVSRTLFKRGAALAPSLAFLFASTNLVVELGLVLLLLMGWQFMAGEWLGGVVLVILLTLLIKLTYPHRLVEAARQHPEAGGGGHDHGAAAAAGTLGQRLMQRQTWISAAHSFVMDWQMLWKDLALGFAIAGLLAAFVPNGVWQALFLHHASPWVQVPLNALLGPIVAMLTFVCSIGNVPMAAVLWGSGVSFGGVLAFLFADLIVLPLLDVYRRYYGWKMAAYMLGLFYATMVLAALIMELVFGAFGWIPPQPAPGGAARMVHFAFNYTFWLNLVFGLIALGLVLLKRRNPIRMPARSCCGHRGATKPAAVAQAHHHHHP
ncbi:permease [Acidisoma sp. C75]